MFSVRGSCLRLAPDGIQISGDKAYVEAINNYVYTFPLSGYRAIAGQLLGSLSMKLFHKLASRFSTNQETINSYSVDVKSIGKQSLNATEENRLGHAAVAEREDGVHEEEIAVQEEEQHLDQHEEEVHHEEQNITIAVQNVQHTVQDGVRTDREQIRTNTSSIHANA